MKKNIFYKDENLESFKNLINKCKEKNEMTEKEKDSVDKYLNLIEKILNKKEI